MNNPVTLVDNFITNVDEILEEVKKPQYQEFFVSRKPSGGMPFKTLDNKGATVESMQDVHITGKLRELCLKTADFGKHFPEPSIVINRYNPGCWLGKHRDSAGSYWKFQLVFLESDRDHFTWYDTEDNPHLVEETPGRMLSMPLHVVHESTMIEMDENPKYSMVFFWGGAVKY